MDRPKRVLSIQSHVVSGYVGNKAAVFPLQLLGFDVDVVNSVHFSNHTGYEKGWEGDVLQGDQLRSIMEGLERNGLLNNIGHVLTGYIGSASFLEAVMDVLKTVRKHSGQKLRYVCDPVLGDVGSGFYVPQELVQLFRERVIPEADVVTPNQFEAEQLTGMTIASVADVRKVCEKLHDIGPRLVVITSVLLPNESDKTISIVASRRDSDGTAKLWRINCPELPGRYTGTGDLLSATLLGHSAINPDNLPQTLEKVMNTMHACIKRSLELSPDIPLDSKCPRGLMLIQCKDIIENPPPVFIAEVME